MSARPVRVLLLWPGTTGAAAGNFGVPQLVQLATWLRARTGAVVTLIDLAMEPLLGPVSLPTLLAGDDGRGYDVVALGCYASYDYLKCLAIAEVARAQLPDAVIVAGGYHASARPNDIVFDGSPYDVCIVGEAELPMVRVVESVAGGSPLRNEILASEPVAHLDVLPPSDWSYLARYRTVARRGASQAQVYLSRGCPFDCAFCMERAKREVSWRSLSVERALEEVRTLHRFLDLRTWTLYIADALFGMKTSWRRAFLEALARAAIPVRKFWLLIRVDLVDDEDLRLFADANCGLGFGLESGDPQLLATIRKAGRLDDYLERMTHIAAVARQYDVPWGANVIVGHPGETPATLARSAAYLRSLFLDTRGTTGFLSVDPFRLYPGSPIDAEREAWTARFGTRFHYPEWWRDGDQEFLSEWVDPSSELTYRERERLSYELLGPVLQEIPERFVYRGRAREYFLRAATDQRAMLSPRWRLAFADRYYAWHRYLGQGTVGRRMRRHDAGLAEICRTLRSEVLPAAATLAGLDEATWRSPAYDALRTTLTEVPREHFVPLDALTASTRDEPVALDATAAATVSAMHAYLRVFDLAGIAAGDVVLDLGSGTGYGLALLARLVGPNGRVVGVELDPKLAALARENLAEHPHVTVLTGDAMDTSLWRDVAPNRVVVGFCLDTVPLQWATVLPSGTILVAPVSDEDTQHLRRMRYGDPVEVERLDAVRYVPQRQVADVAPIEQKRRLLERSNTTARKHLPLVR